MIMTLLTIDDNDDDDTMLTVMDYLESNDDESER